MAQLSEYKRKRNLRITPEPAGRVARKRGHSFVIQKHHASHLHYDFRLEIDGVLKSWAVPKGPSLDPAVKRLAVEVEDHPLAYASFEGTIPEKQYGAGSVIVWDRGTWTPEADVHTQLRSGRLRFALHGEKLNGTWNLVRGRSQGGKPTWLLIKSHDELAQSTADYDVTKERPESVISGALLDIDQVSAVSSTKGSKKTTTRAAKVAKATKTTKVTKTSTRKSAAKTASPRAHTLPEFIAPQLATLMATPPTGEQFIHEIKFDGYRALGRIDHGKGGTGVTVTTRNGNNWTEKFRSIAAALERLDVNSAYLDGEIVALGPNGQSDFQALQNSFDKSPNTPLYYFIFDLLFLNGHDLRDQPLLNRKALLQELLEKDPQDQLRYSSHWSGDAEKFLQQCCRQKLEGMVCKDGGQPYRSGRNADWLKVKCKQRQEFVIVGYTAPKGGRQHFGALLLGVQNEAGLHYVGRVGTGFSVASLGKLKKVLAALVTKQPPVENPPRERGNTWVRPQLVCEVEFGEFTKDQILRHAVFHGLREDKKAKEVKLEKPAVEPTPRKEKKAPLSKAAVPKRTKSAPAKTAQVTLTHPDKVLFPPDGPNKQEVADYYEKIARRMLPYVERRPLALLRFPQGAGKAGFFQKHVALDRVETGLAAIALAEKHHTQQYRYLVTAQGLRSMVQLSALELHVWGSRIDDPEHADELVFDLDPAPDVNWQAVISGAQEVRKLLAHLKLKSFLKLTGGKGVHLHVPIAPRYSWEQVKSFCQAVAKQLEQSQPQRFTASLLKAKRTGKIFLDYLRNQRGALYVAPFSVRGRAGAPVAVPISWTALTTKLRPDSYTVRSVDKYLKDYPRDPWAGYFKLAQRIPLLE